MTDSKSFDDKIQNLLRFPNTKKQVEELQKNRQEELNKYLERLDAIYCSAINKIYDQCFVKEMEHEKNEVDTILRMLKC